MNRISSIFFNKIAFCLSIALIGTLIGLFVEKKAHKSPDVAEFAASLETALHQSEEELERMFNNGSFLLNAVEGYVLSDTIQKYLQKPFTFIIYDDRDSMVYWNNNNILPFQSDINYSLTDTVEKYRIRESVFLKVRRPIDFRINNQTYYYNLEALIPIYRHFSIQNNYLDNYFTLMPPEFSEFVDISEDPNDVAIKDRLGRTIIYIKAKSDFPDQWYVVFSTVLYLISTLLLILAVFLISCNLARKNQMLRSLSFMVLSFALLRIVLLFYDFPLLVQQLEIFNIRLSDLNRIWYYSLGDFVLDMFLLLVLAIFVSTELKKGHVRHYAKGQQWLFALGSFLLIAGGLAALQLGLRDIVMTAYISFEFNDFSNIDRYSLLALTNIGLLFCSYFFISYRFYVLLSSFQLNKSLQIGLFVLALGAVILVAWQYGILGIDIGVFSIAALLNVLALSYFSRRKNSSLVWISLWLLFFSTLATVILENANLDKGILLRKSFAKTLAYERDIETEKTFSSLYNNIMEDGLLKISLNNPLSPSPRRQAIDLLTYRYLDNYFFGRYDYKIHLYTARGKPYRGEKRSFDELMELIDNSRPTNSENLFFYSHPDSDYSYFAKLDISQNKSVFARVIIEFKPKKNYKKSNIYVELLSRNQQRFDKVYNQIQYALYKYEERVASNENYFQAQLNYNLKRPEPGQYLKIKIINEDKKKLKNNKNHNNNYLIYRSDFEDNNIAIVNIPQLSILRIMSVFAYLFCFGIILLFGGQLVNLALFRFFSINLINFEFENTLREQIQRVIIQVTLFSFVLIASFTIYNYRYQYNKYHTERLERKIRSTERTAAWQIEQTQDSLFQLPHAKSLSGIHKIDVNIYDLSGNLVSSSEEVIFERHLLSRKMEPRAFQRLKNEQKGIFSQNEIINNFEYISAYVALKDKNERTIAYLNLPYDLAGSQNIGSQDVADFLGALLNVYVIILLFAGGVAFFVANSVTNPLLVIARKLAKVQLGRKNDPIKWDKNDEIGELVERYNKMIEELEENTKKLARSQRESAWREMAKQVAHEIKNPLTPMKLNIQLLERVVNSNPDKAQKMVKRVSKTLIEQIDSLAHIASEFSSFAKMPIANNKQLQLNELVQNAYNLFKEEENVQVSLNLTEEDCQIFADKTQIMRVLNNLLKNAVQAIPEDQPGRIRLSLQVHNKKALIQVSDNGIGIPIEQEEDIFIPNFTTKSSGTGIGLAMSKTIVEMAKGSIYFESEVNKGTDFFVELPLLG